MIDLHTHILPGIDDGASNLEEALTMVNTLRLQDVNIAVCTPHFNAKQIALDEFIHKRSQAFSIMAVANISLITGSETALNDYLFHYSDLSSLCIGSTKYILIELPFTRKWEEKMYDMLEELIRYYSLLPIIAHVERYPAIGNKVKILHKLMDMGCSLQVNTASILQEKSWHQIAKYIKHGCIDVISSDCHNMTNRPPMISQAYDKIRKEFGDAECQSLISNAEKIINGNELRANNQFIL